MKIFVKKFAYIAIALMLIGLAPRTVFAAAYADTEGHWADEYISKWSSGNMPVLAGYGASYGNTFGPNDPMRSGDLDIMIERIFGVERTSWETSSHITRDLAAKKIAEAFDIEPRTSIDQTEMYDDHNQIDPECVAYVYALKDRYVMNGIGGNFFAPKSMLTRAEALTIVYDMIDAIVDYTEEYTDQEYVRTVVVRNSGVTLQNKTFSGDLIVAQGVGEGDAAIENSTIGGRLIVFGGGDNSVVIKNSKIRTIVAAKTTGGAANLEIDNFSEVGEVDVRANSKTTLSGSVPYVSLEENAALRLANDAVVGEVEIEGSKASLALDGSSAIGAVSINSAATDTSMNVGTNAKIGDVNVNAAGARITGPGSVTNVTVAETAGKTVVSTSGTSINNNSAEAVVDDTGKSIADSGATGKTETTKTDDTDNDTANNNGGGSYSGGGNDNDDNDTPTAVKKVTISLLDAVKPENAATSLAQKTGYTGTITWVDDKNTAIPFTGTFVQGESYTATVTLTARTGYEFTAGTAVETSPVLAADAVKILSRNSKNIVFSAKFAVVPPTGITLNAGEDVTFSMIDDGEGTLVAEPGTTLSKTLEAVFEPVNTTYKTLTWESSDPETVSVAAGVVTAHKPGTARITAYSEARQLSASCDVTVTAESMIEFEHSTWENTTAQGLVGYPELQEDYEAAWGNINYDIKRNAANDYTVELSGTAGLVEDFTGFNGAPEMDENNGYYLAYWALIPEYARSAAAYAEGTIYSSEGSKDTIEHESSSLEQYLDIEVAGFEWIIIVMDDEGEKLGDEQKIIIKVDWDGPDEDVFTESTFTFDFTELDYSGLSGGDPTDGGEAEDPVDEGGTTALSRRLRSENFSSEEKPKTSSTKTDTPSDENAKQNDTNDTTDTEPVQQQDGAAAPDANMNENTKDTEDTSGDKNDLGV